MSRQPIRWTALGLAAMLASGVALAAEKPPTFMSGSVQKREFTNTVPVLSEIQQLDFKTKAGREISLKEVMQKTLENDVRIRQARIELKSRKDQPPVLPNVLTLLNPIDLAHLKEAADHGVEAARFHEQAVIQKALLENARLYVLLSEAWMARQLAFQTLDQTRRDLKADQERFLSGETNRFDVTRREITLIDNYHQFLKTQNAYDAASAALATVLRMKPEPPLVPAETNPAAAKQPEPLDLVDPNLTLRQAVAAAIEGRPDLRELKANSQAMNRLAKGSPRSDQPRLEGQTEVLELQLDQARLSAEAAVEKAFNDYMLSNKARDLAAQQLQLAEQSVRQLEVSHEAGFSSSKEVMDGKAELLKARSNLARAIHHYNLSQLQLLAELGVLKAL